MSVIHPSAIVAPGASIGEAARIGPFCTVGPEVVIEEGELRKSVEGRQYAVKPAFDESIEDHLRPLFQQHYTMSFENYPVAPDRIHDLQIVDRSQS